MTLIQVVLYMRLYADLKGAISTKLLLPTVVGAVIGFITCQYGKHNPEVDVMQPVSMISSVSVAGENKQSPETDEAKPVELPSQLNLLPLGDHVIFPKRRYWLETTEKSF